MNNWIEEKRNHYIITTQKSTSIISKGINVIMCNTACLDFGQTHLTQEEIEGKSVIEVGSLNVNGSLREIVQPLKPSKYLGVDIAQGPGVDEICNATDLIQRFGEEKFDWLLSTELLEHARDWRKVVSNFKRLLKSNGTLLITTRSKGFKYHGYPFDFWRYEAQDLENIFADFENEIIQKDPLKPGIFLKAKKPNNFRECELSEIKLYSMIKGKRAKNITSLDVFLFKIGHRIWHFPSKVTRALK